MRPSPVIGNHPRVGVEIEISRWEEQTKHISDWHKIRNRKSLALVEAGLMPTQDESITLSQQSSYATKYHQWNCACGVCKGWELDDCDPYPVQFALKYDGTLPLTGGEYISTPFIIDQMHWASFFKGWNLITDTAVPDYKIENKQGNHASPSIHVHASCVNEQYETAGINALTDTIRFAYMYAPEITALAFTPHTPARSMKYRSLYPEPSKSNWKFMNISEMRKIGPGGMPIVKDGAYVAKGPHIELRTWEPEYKDPRYIEGAVHVTAALAQIMSAPLLTDKLSSLAETVVPERQDTYNYYHNIPTLQAAMDLVEPKLFATLRHALTSVTYATQDPLASEAIEYMFHTTEQVI